MIQDKINTISDDFIEGCIKFHQNNLLSWILKEKNGIDNDKIFRNELRYSIQYENYESLDFLLQNYDNDIQNIGDELLEIVIKFGFTDLLPILIKKGVKIDVEGILTKFKLSSFTRFTLSQNDIDEIHRGQAAK